MKFCYVLILIFTLSSMFFLQNDANAFLSKNDFPHETISIDKVIIDAMVANTTENMEQGLQNQTILPYNQGMLFVVPTPQVISMWMPNMQFSLDMMWFDSNGNILHIEKNVPPCTTELYNCPVYDREGPPAKYAIEVTSGFLDKNNITMNSKLSFPTNVETTTSTLSANNQTTVPEFGPLSGMIIAISIIWVVIISRNHLFN